MSRSRTLRSFGIWFVPAVVVAMALAINGQWSAAVGIGLAAGLSLSGSV